MARASTSDPLLAHNFALLDVPVAGGIPVAFPVKAIQDRVAGNAFVGFRSVRLPTVSLETKDIKEGNNPYIHKVPTGFVTSGQVELEMGLFPWNIDMFLYFQQAVQGTFSPRRSFILVNLKNEKYVPWRTTILEGCVPTEWSPSSDNDATSSEVLVERLTLDVHRVYIVPAPIPPVPVNAPPLTPQGVF